MLLEPSVVATRPVEPRSPLAPTLKITAPDFTVCVFERCRLACEGTYWRRKRQQAQHADFPTTTLIAFCPQTSGSESQFVPFGEQNLPFFSVFYDWHGSCDSVGVGFY